MSKLCPQCEKENPSSANHCMHCGSTLTPVKKVDELDKLHSDLNEIKKTNKLLKSALEAQLKKNEEKEKTKSESIAEKPMVSDRIYNEPIKNQRKTNKKITGLIAFLVLIALTVFGFFYYSNIYLPAKIDREADRYYTFADKTNLRYSKEAGVDYNLIASLNYGSELITYSHDIRDWSDVKDASGNKGFISSNLLLNKHDFSILNGIFGDQESRQCINTAKCRLALLSYYKDNNLDGNWKIYCKPKDIKPNAVFYSRIFNKSSKFTDFATIIKNIQTGERKIVIFGFNDDESLALTRYRNAPIEGYIKNIYINNYGTIVIDYSNN